MPRRKRDKRDEPLVYNSLDELLALLEAEREKTLKHRRYAKIGLGLYLGLIALMLVVGIAGHFHNMGGFGGMFGGLGGVIASMYAATQTQRKGLQALASYDDIQAVPRLIELLEYNDNGMRLDASSLLQNLLPRLQASDAAMLSLEHHAILNRLLSGKLKLPPQPGVLLSLVILRALEQVGDASSLPVVEQLAEGKGLAHSVTTQEAEGLRQAAQQCLPALQMRAENQRQTQTLLRASTGNQTAPDTLLRPAMSTLPTTPAGELLRVAPVHPNAPVETQTRQTAPAPQFLSPEEQEQPQTTSLHLS